MVKTLSDCCLQCIAINLRILNRPGVYLTRAQKEVLLERMCWNDQFTKENLPAISYNLLSDNLNRIHLAYSSKVNDDVMKLLFSCKCSPKWLTIHNCKEVTNKGLTYFTELISQVETLQLRKLLGLNDSVICSLAVSKHLSHLDLRESEGVTDTGLMYILKRCPNITYLNVAFLSQLTDKSLTEAAIQLRGNLTELDAAKVYNITSASAQTLAENCCNLAILNFINKVVFMKLKNLYLYSKTPKTKAQNLKYNEKIIDNHIQSLKKLVNFDGCLKLNGSGILMMAQKCNLKVLKLSFCYGINSQAIGRILQCDFIKSNLEELEVFGATFDINTSVHLEKFSNLSKLSLCGVMHLTDDMIAKIFMSIGDKLTKIDLSNCNQLTNNMCGPLVKYCTNLEDLCMKAIPDLSSIKLADLFTDKKRAIAFKCIVFSACKNLPIEVIEAIVMNCHNLETLMLAACKEVDDTVVFSIAKNCPKLKRLSLRGCKATDPSICEIATHCQDLLLLALAGLHKLTDKCVIALAENCPYLEELFISGCGMITTAATRYLQDCSVNRVFIHHVTPNVPPNSIMAKDLDTGEYTRMDNCHYTTYL